MDKIDVRLGLHVHPGEMLVQMRDQYAASQVATARAALKTPELNDENVRMNGSKEDRIVRKAAARESMVETVHAALELKDQIQQQAESCGKLQRSIRMMQKRLDLLDARLQLNKARLSLLRQTGQLDDWLHILLISSTGP